MMKQSANPASYYVQPPDIPEFLYRTSLQAWRNLMVWSYREYRIRLQKRSREGNFLELKNQSDNYSPVRILAESHGFRRFCAMLIEPDENGNPRGLSVWNKMTKDERKYIRSAYELREILFR